jgi:hypothetical protein
MIYTYKLLNDPLTNKQINIILRSDGACIPFDLDNIDYQTYLTWVSEGNTPEPAEG